MATIVNARDVLLQAAAERVLPVTLPDNVSVPTANVIGLPELAENAKGLFLRSSSQVFQISKAGANSPGQITFNPLLRNIVGTISWSVTPANAATLTSGSGSSKVLAFANMSQDVVTIKASVVSDGTTYEDEITIVKLREGSDSITGLLTNESVTVPADPNGNVASLASAGGTFKVFHGIVDKTGDGVTYAVKPNSTTSGLTATINATTGVYTVTGLTENFAATVFTASYTFGGVTTVIEKVYTIAKAIAGIPGYSAKMVYLTSTSQVFQIAKSGSVSPASVTVTAEAKNLDGASSPVFTIKQQDGTTSTLSGTGNTRSIGNAILTGDTAEITVTQDGQTDKITLIKLREGIDGLNPITGLLTNEAMVVPAATDGTVTSFSNAGGTFKVFEGLTDRTADATYSVVSPAGLTISIDTAGAYTVTAMSADIGTATLRAVYKGVTLDKVYTISKSKAGANGAAGTWVSYVFTASATTPATPTGTATIPSGWNDAPPVSADPVWMSKATITGTTAGTWSTPIKVSGKDGSAGANGKYTVYRYAKNTSTTTAPTTWGSEGVIPSVGTDEYLWMQAGEVTPPATSPTAWSTAARITGEKGAAGTSIQGDPGPRGNVNVARDVSAVATIANRTQWSDTEASTAISINGYGSPQNRDQVTLYNEAEAFSETRYYLSGSWLVVAAYINGNMIVSGTLAASIFNGDLFTGNQYQTASSGQRVVIYGPNASSASRHRIEVYDSAGNKVAHVGGNSGSIAAISSNNHALWGETTQYDGFGVYGWNRGTNVAGRGVYGICSHGQAIRGESANGWAGHFEGKVKITSSLDVAGITATTFSSIAGISHLGGEDGLDTLVLCKATHTASHALRGTNTAKNQTTKLNITSGLVGTAGPWNFYADGEDGTVDYGTFTGGHDALVMKTTPIEVGSIVVDVQVIARSGISNVITEVEQSAGLNQKGVVGVLAAYSSFDAMTPNALYENPETYYEVKDQYDYVAINSLGEGQLLVCGRGGDLEAGDLIVASSMPGKGQKQADDIVRGYTVAKSRENVTFSSPDEVKMVACIYLCG